MFRHISGSRDNREESRAPSPKEQGQQEGGPRQTTKVREASKEKHRFQGSTYEQHTVQCVRGRHTGAFPDKMI